MRPSFIEYASPLPPPDAKPRPKPKPGGSRPKPKPITTQAVGEEQGQRVVLEGESR